MGTLGVAAGPLEDGTGMGTRLQVLGRVYLELAALGDTPGLLVGTVVLELGRDIECVVLTSHIGASLYLS